MENREELNPQRTNPRPAEPLQSSTRPGHPPVPAAPADDDDGAVPESPPTLRYWLVANSIPLAIVAAIIALVCYKFNWDSRLAIAKAFLGLSFVVFIHELGHFLVAKWCDVEVTTFSIGFGPAVPGCSWRWGETTYKLSLIPVGGYVQMVGQVDGDEASDGSEDNPRSYRNKSVGQRMAIISAGVIMNVILAVICFIVVYRGPGKERPAGVVGPVDTGAPAFKYGIRTGAEILEIGDVQKPHFENVVVVVMSSTHGEQIKFVSKLPSGEAQEVDIEPRLDKNDSKPMLGISPARQLQLQTRRGLDPQVAGPYFPASAAARATPTPGLQFGDRIIACSDPAAPNHAVTPLPDDPRLPNHGRHDYFEFARRMRLLAAEPVVLRGEREEQGNKTTHDITVPPMYGLTLGMRMQIGQITVIRVHSPADQAELKARDPAAGREGDVIEAVEVVDADGKDLRFEGSTLDPVRLPYQLKEWAQRLAEAEKRGTLTTHERDERSKVKLTVRRHRAGGGAQFANQTITVAWDDGWRFDEALPISGSAPMAIPELGLAYQVKTIVAGISDGPAKGQVQPGDVIKNYRYTYVDFDGNEDTTKWRSKDLEEGDWAHSDEVLLRTPARIASIELKLERGKDQVEVKLEPATDTNRPLADRGWIFMTDMRRQRADNFYDAIAMGLRDTRDGMVQVYQNLRGMITRRVSIDNLGGPVMIANFAYRFAGYDFWEFVFFLGLISVNLAVVNFLPVPVLDGGHMVFLIYEKLRGRPASEPVRVAMTYAGLAMILSLFLFVTWNDIHRFFF